MKQRKTTNPILALIYFACTLGLLPACAKSSDLSKENKTEGAPAEIQLTKPIQIEVEDVTISGENLRLVSGIEYVDGYLYVAEKVGVIYRLNLDMSGRAKASLDTDFAEAGKIDINEEIRTIAASGKDLIIRTKKGLYQMHEGKISAIENISTARGFSFSDDGSVGVGHRTGSGTADERVPIVLLKKSKDGFESTPILNGSQHGITNLNKSAITPSLILLGGASPKIEGKGLKHELVAFSHEGELQFRVGNDDVNAPDGFAYVHDIEMTNDFIYLLDSNLRDLLVISPSGEVLNKIDMKKLLNVGYSWFPDSTIGPNQSLILAVVNDDDEEDVETAKFFIIPSSELQSATN